MPRPEWERADEELEKHLSQQIAELETRIKVIQEMGSILEVGAKEAGAPGGFTVIAKAPPDATAALVCVYPALLPSSTPGQIFTSIPGACGLIFPDGKQVSFGAASFQMNRMSAGGGISMWSASELPISWMFIKAKRNDG
jgi:hypothetical protein